VIVAIHFPTPPQAVVAAAEELPGATRAAGLIPLDELGGAPPAIQPVFTAGLDALVANDGDVEQVAEAPESWRYASELGGAVEVVSEGDGETAHVTSEGDDRFTEGIRQALSAAQDDPRVNSGDYEARLLRVPALKLIAVWLHGDNVDDLFVPVAATAVGATPSRVYDASDFQSRLVDAAAQTLGQYEGAERPDELGG
jgi:hypothetical protein